MIKLLWLTIAILSLACLEVTAQQMPRKNLSDSIKERNILKYLGNDTLNVPHYILDSIFTGFQKGISGSQVKEGKLAGSSLTVEDKGATVNLMFKTFSFDKAGSLSTGVNFSGRGEESLVKVFEDGAYQNTLSSGLVINYFPKWNSASYFRSNALQTKTIVQDYNDKYSNAETLNSLSDPFAIKGLGDFLRKQLDTLKYYENKIKNEVETKPIKQSQVLKSRESLDFIPLSAAEILAAREARDTLIALKYLPATYAKMSTKERKEALADIKIVDSNLRRKNYLEKVESELMKASWTAYSIHWFTAKFNYNVSPFDMLDASMPDENYLDKKTDHFFSGSISYNYTKKFNRSRGFQFSLFPTLTISTALDFSELKETTITKIESYVLGGQTFERKVFESTGYTSIPERKTGWSLEYPMVFFWGKSNFGIDVAIRTGKNNPYGNNHGGRLGLYVPVDIKDGVPVWIEPIFEVGKLFQSEKVKLAETEKETFWEKNVSVGFKLSVAVPNFKALKN